MYNKEFGFVNVTKTFLVCYMRRSKRIVHANNSSVALEHKLFIVHQL